MFTTDTIDEHTEMHVEPEKGVISDYGRTFGERNKTMKTHFVPILRFTRILRTHIACAQGTAGEPEP